MWDTKKKDSGARNTWSKSSSGLTGDTLSDNTLIFKLAEILERGAAYKTPKGKDLRTFHHNRKISVLGSSSPSYCTKKGLATCYINLLQMSWNTLQMLAMESLSAAFP